MILVLGALLGLISVAFGAYAEHGLRPNISEEYFRFLMTAIRYNQVNAVIICAIGLALLHGNKLSDIKVLRWSGLAFIVGTALFSFSIYLSVYFDIPAITSATPVGGVTMMIAWVLLLFAGLQARRKS